MKEILLSAIFMAVGFGIGIITNDNSTLISPEVEPIKQIVKVSVIEEKERCDELGGRFDIRDDFVLEGDFTVLKKVMECKKPASELFRHEIEL